MRLIASLSIVQRISIVVISSAHLSLYDSHIMTAGKWIFIRTDEYKP